ncbi:restriction endonuclease subunit S [Rhizobium sp. BK399]|uniref:restriction endonuclease subunit S n=1 Tax=Rhizobium sp. BK399 TaxID=2587063 RepID=UPI00161B5C88|nr:restriction endonuclease subunit S [Rhizobium sp. BK399]MBB3545482.1 type I restriction enzyme S subunit [Rhizobium sp. BK399]
MTLATWPTYDSYKDSGVEWIGDVPDQWLVEPGRQCLYENKDKNTGMKESTVLSLSYGRVIVKDEDKLTGLVPESFETYQVVQPSDIIIRGTDLQNDKTSLRTGLAKDKGIITSAYINLRPKAEIDPVFLHYLLHSYDVKKVFYALGSGLRQNLSYDDFKYLRLPIPSPTEQRAIVAFLDEKCANVDEAVRIEEEQIALLRERRKILIHQAVTRGLAPNAPMKDSGIDWIGQIPSHWEQRPNKHIFHLKKSLVGKRSSEYELLSLTLRGIIKRDMENPEGKFPAEFDTYQEVEPNDFVFCHFDVEETPRTVGLSEFSGMITGAYTVYSVTDGIDPRFLLHFYICADTDKKMRSLYKGLRNTIPKEAFGAFKTPLPPIDEQREIVAHIDEATRKIEDAISIKEEQIAVLKEYRTSLIDATVTGKIKVE